jgi:hypothetical protein
MRAFIRIAKVGAKWVCRGIRQMKDRLGSSRFFPMLHWTDQKIRVPRLSLGAGTDGSAAIERSNDRAIASRCQ